MKAKRIFALFTLLLIIVAIWLIKNKKPHLQPGTNNKSQIHP
ncbi:MAG: hypothetical protein REI78_07810 [Pedobacter sp.]|nr:hypothetical protein [Pedobacter sp.]MDQ8052917.1 hypothetical protein [Pedobacter sp.]